MSKWRKGEKFWKPEDERLLKDVGYKWKTFSRGVCRGSGGPETHY